MLASLKANNCCLSWTVQNDFDVTVKGHIGTHEGVESLIEDPL